MSEETAARGESARQVLDNPQYREAWTDLEAAYIEALIDLDRADDDAARRLREGVKVLRMVKRHLESTLEAGQVAAKDIREIELGKKSFF